MERIKNINYNDHFFHALTFFKMIQRFYIKRILKCFFIERDKLYIDKIYKVLLEAIMIKKKHKKSPNFIYYIHYPICGSI